MRYKSIACKVFARELSLLIARSPAVIDVTWIPQGLHSYPSLLRDEIQAEIDRTEAPWDRPDAPARPPEEYSGIILAFGLCSRAIAGLSSTRLPIIVPKSHDCIALLLGSHKRYREQFDAAPGTYWFSPGWIEQAAFPSGEQCALMKERFAELYGDDNGEYLVELERDSLASYTRAALITWPHLDRPEYEARLQEIAEDFGWKAERVSGDHQWMQRILDGDWRDEEAVSCPPGMTLDASNDDEIISIVSQEEPVTETQATPRGQDN